MCGRYASARDKHQLLEEFRVEQDADPDKELGPDYNVAPTKNVYAVMDRVPEGAERAVRQLRVVKWGLVPAWAKDPSVGSRMKIGKHTSELQSRENLVCRLLLEKKKK